ncbi:hypothetical protein [Sphingobacterium ginsenosidimutans]|uniref:hypothetical protein n=1 Tax=Sphingobacterium ginsenosidimutans TaxID=687845 RepID=UPI0031F8FC51
MNTEQERIADRAIPLVNGFERCSELVESENARLSFVKETLLLPDAVLILRSSYPFSIWEPLQLSASRNRRQKIAHTLPIFLQYRTLRI